MIVERPFRSLSSSEQISVLLRSLLRLIPILLVALAFLIATAPFFPPFSLMPNFGVLLVFLFTLYRPNQLKPWVGVPLGVFADLLFAMPVGANALLLPLFMLGIIFVDTKTTRVHWLADWVICVPFILGYQTLLWMTCSIVGTKVPLVSFLTQGAATLAVFPFIAFLFVSMQRRFVDNLG